MILESEEQEVKGRTQPQVKAGKPHQHSVLETLGQVRVRGVPRHVPVLKQQNTNTHTHTHTPHTQTHTNELSELGSELVCNGIIFSLI